MSVTSDTTEITPRAFFTPLEAFRGFAALMVAWFHSSIVNGDKLLLIKPGNIYVDFFFVLSGFVLMHAYADRIGRGMSFYNFAVLRLARIWPLHMFMLGVFVLYGTVQWLAFAKLGIGDGIGERNTFQTFLYNVLLIHSLGLAEGLTWNYPSWSISVEYYTHLIFYVIIFVFFGRMYSISLAISLLGFIGLFWMAYILGKSSILASYDYGIVRCIAGFFAGTATYGLFKRAPLLPRSFMMTLAEGFCLALSLWLVSHSVGNGKFQFASIMSFVLLIFIFAFSGGAFSRFFSLTPFRFLGKISFSIYMIHAIFMSALGFAIPYILSIPKVEVHPDRYAYQTEFATLINISILSLVVVTSYFTYRFIEVPGQERLKKLLLKQPP